MRRTVAVLIVLSLFALGSSAASAATRASISIRAVVAQADWEEVDPETGAGEFGFLQFATEKTGTTVVLAVSRGELILCEGAQTPDDPSDDFYGFLGTSIQGDGRARLTVGRSYSSANGSATIQAQVSSVNECTGGSSVDSAKRVTVALELTSIGPVMIQKGRTTLAIPRQLRTKTFVRSRSREAAGTAVVDGRTLQVGGVVGDLSLRAMVIQQ
jgi:hypothetical protein